MMVQLETPFAADNEHDLNQNVRYARLAMHDCLMRGEAPFASHLLYTQPEVLDDTIPAERKLGIEAGLVIGGHADKTVVYTDRGISKGMQLGIEHAEKLGRPVEYRTVPGYWDVRKCDFREKQPAAGEPKNHE